MKIHHPLRCSGRTKEAILKAPYEAIYLARHYVDTTLRPDITYINWAERFKAKASQRPVVLDHHVHEYALEASIEDYVTFSAYYQFVTRVGKRLLHQEAHLQRVTLYSAIGHSDPFEYAKRGSAMLRYQPCFIVAFDHGEPIVCTHPAGRYHRRPVTEYHFRPYTT